MSSRIRYDLRAARKFRGWCIMADKGHCRKANASARARKRWKREHGRRKAAR